MSFTTYLTATNPSIQEAVNTLTSTIAAEAASDNLETALWKTWSEFLHLVADTPHATQQPLVDFLQALRKAPNPKKEDGELYELWGGPFKWQNLPLFGAQLREDWDVVPRTGAPEEHLQQWINKNAFVARITAISEPENSLDYSLYAVWSLRDVLEETNAPSSRPTTRDLGTAAVWLLYAGKVLRENSIEGRDFEGRMGKEGDAVGEKGWKGLNEERWKYWIESLEKLEKTIGEGESKDLVKKALQGVSEM